MSEQAVVESRKHLAEQRLEQIYSQLGQACANEFVLEQSWVRLGQMLAGFEADECWRDLGFVSFEKFMLQLQEKYKRSRTQLWAYLGAAKYLLPIMDGATLEAIGISKALELKRGIVQGGGKPLPASVIASAQIRQVTAKELRAMIGQAFNLPPDNKGSWYDLNGFYMSPEERHEFNNCVRMTKSLLGIKNDVPEHIQRYEIFMAWVREFWATHAADVYGPPTHVNTPATLMLPSVTPESAKEEQ